MSAQIESLEDLRTLNRIAETLNRARDVNSALYTALGTLIPLMGLQTGWISLVDPDTGQFHLAAYVNLPDELSPENTAVWQGTCTCQELARENALDRAYTEVHCSRLASLPTCSKGLRVHASTPLLAGDHLLGILNVAAPDWSAFDDRSLMLLSSVGKQIGTALERARLYDRLKEKRHHEQATLVDFSRKLLSRLDLADLTQFLTREIVNLLDADACSLVMPSQDNDRLEFVASHGWREDPLQSGHTIPLNAGSGPEWAMIHQQNLLVTDLDYDDPTLWSSDWLEAEGFRAHAVIPLISEDRSLGALVINNRTPRLLRQDELRLLQLMSQQAALAIDSARLLEERTRRLQLEQELAIGRQIQASLLPASLPSIPGYEFAMLYQPAREVGGDFYDFCQNSGKENKLCIFIGDVSGKGIPAAMFMAMCRTHVRSSMLSGRTPAQALSRANTMILNDSRDGLFLSAIGASLNPETHQVTYANAGHDRPLMVRHGGTRIETLNAKGIILGAFDSVQLEEQVIEMQPGDELILFTDGVKDALNASGEPFGLEGLKRTLENASHESARKTVSTIANALKTHRGHASQTDDVTVLVIRRDIQAGIRPVEADDTERRLAA